MNGCVISACNYLAVVETQHRLDPNFWAKVLLVRFDNQLAGHAYCVWETDGTIYGYDRNSGGFPIPVYTRDPRSIAIVLAMELSKIIQKPLAVTTAEFVEPAKAELYKFSGANTSDVAPGRDPGTCCNQSPRFVVQSWPARIRGCGLRAFSRLFPSLFLEVHSAGAASKALK